MIWLWLALAGWIGALALGWALCRMAAGDDVPGAQQRLLALLAGTLQGMDEAG